MSSNAPSPRTPMPPNCNARSPRLSTHTSPRLGARKQYNIMREHSFCSTDSPTGDVTPCWGVTLDPVTKKPVLSVQSSFRDDDLADKTSSPVITHTLFAYDSRIAGRYVRPNILADLMREYEQRLETDDMSGSFPASLPDRATSPMTIPEEAPLVVKQKSGFAMKQTSGIAMDKAADKAVDKIADTASEAKPTALGRMRALFLTVRWAFSAGHRVVPSE